MNIFFFSKTVYILFKMSDVFIFPDFIPCMIPPFHEVLQVNLCSPGLYPARHLDAREDEDETEEGGAGEEPAGAGEAEAGDQGEEEEGDDGVEDILHDSSKPVGVGELTEP